MRAVISYQLRRGLRSGRPETGPTKSPAGAGLIMMRSPQGELEDKRIICEVAQIDTFDVMTSAQQLPTERRPKNPQNMGSRPPDVRGSPLMILAPVATVKRLSDNRSRRIPLMPRPAYGAPSRADSTSDEGQGAQG